MLLQGIDFPVDQRLIAGAGAEDAGVLRLDRATGLILTVDFFTPIVDDPYSFGGVAAANSLSDVYAMGGEPLAVLNICAFPPGADSGMLRSILQGGADKVREAGAVMAGGHSVRDEDLKYGMAVIGRVHPDKVVANSGARPGDSLVLTKAIGTGLLSTARRKDAISEEEFQPAVEFMLELNRAAAQAMVELGASACTDVTGFGLLGHAHEMACASNVGMVTDASSVPLLSGARRCAEQGYVPAGTKANREHFAPFVEGDAPDQAWWHLLFDAQTSGGLLVSISKDRALELLERLNQTKIRAAIIGEVTDGPRGRIGLRF